MSHGRPKDLQLDVDALPPDASAAIEAAIAGECVALVRSGRSIGTLEFRSNVLEGTVIDTPGQHRSGPAPEGVTVVATAMKLSDAARRRLSDEFGAEYIVLDMRDAPPTTDVLLIHPVSPQLLGMLREHFPQARIVVAEIEDEELGVSYSGPVGRMLDAGANAYLSPRPIAQLAADVHAYVTQGDEKILESGRLPSTELPKAPPSELEASQGTV